MAQLWLNPTSWQKPWGIWARLRTARCPWQLLVPEYVPFASFLNASPLRMLQKRSGNAFETPMLSLSKRRALSCLSFLLPVHANITRWESELLTAEQRKFSLASHGYLKPLSSRDNGSDVKTHVLKACGPWVWPPAPQTKQDVAV